jgi:solute carrier family 25 S-adenosylmethionine transporter 26
MRAIMIISLAVCWEAFALQSYLPESSFRWSSGRKTTIGRRRPTHLYVDITQIGVLYQSLPIADAVQVEQHTMCSNFDWNKYALAGAFAGGSRAFSRAFTYPLDTMKTIEQTESAIRPKKVDYFRGLFLSVLSAIPANAIFFVAYYYLDQLLHCSGMALSTSSELIEKMAISVIATLPQNVIKIPAEVIKQRAQIQPDIPIMTLMYETYSKEGISGFYAGSGAQLLRELPYNALQMAIFDIIHEQALLISQHWDKEVVAAVLGLIAASIAAILTQPADCIKTKIMTAASPTGSSAESRTTSSGASANPFAAACADIWQSSGWQGFFAGLVPRLLIVSIGGTVYFLAAALVEDAMTLELSNSRTL